MSKPIKNSFANKMSPSLRLIPWVIAIALFMETLDITIISTTIPKMAQDLGINPLNLKLALTSYLLSLAIFIPISGWLADRLGTKKIFATAILIFTVSSACCGVAQNLLELVISRLLQGLGGALMMPVGRLILLKTFPKDEIMRVMNYTSIPALLGPALGPLIGGFIATYYSWRWIFYINVPFGIIGFFLSLNYIIDYKRKKIVPFDIFGFILLSLSLSGFLFGLESIGEHYFSLIKILSIILFSSIFLLFYLFYFRIAKHPVFDLNILYIRTFRITVFGSLLSRLGIGGIPFLLPLLFQIGFGFLPIYSGFLIVPLALAMLLMKFYIKSLLRTFGFKKLLIVNTLLVGLSIASFSLIEKTTPAIMIILLVFLNGLLTSLQFSCMNNLTYIDLNKNNLSKGTSIASTVQQLSMCLGIAVSALAVDYYLGVGNAMKLGTILPIHKTFILLGAITCTASLSFMKLSNKDGEEISGYSFPKKAG